MSRELRVLNAQRARRVNLGWLRRLLQHLLAKTLALEDFDIVIHLVGAAEMTRVNETHLRHAGSTDVITFDYSGAPPLPPIAGELFICVDEAMAQARRFRTSWQEELVRYAIHGILHLRGHDDLQFAARRRMKREENRLVREMIRQFDLSKLERKPKVTG